MADINPAEQTFAISVLRGTGTEVTARTVTRAELWQRLATHVVEPVKLNAEAFIPAEITPCPTPCRRAGLSRAHDCGGGKRHRLASNVRSVSLFVVDVDKWPEERVRECLAALDATGLAYVYTTTHSHRPPEECCARLVFPLSHPYAITDPKHWQSVVWPALMHIVGIDPATADRACSDPSRLYFLPSVASDTAPREVVIREGRPIDTNALPVPAPKPHLALVAPLDITTARRSASRDVVITKAMSACVDRAEDLTLLDAVANGFGLPEGSRHNLLNRAVWLLAKHSDADDASILSALGPTLDVSGDDEDWHAEAERSLEGARTRLQEQDAESVAFEALREEQGGHDRGYAARVARLHGAEMRCPNGDFFVWDGMRWEGGETAESKVIRCIADTANTYEADLAALTETLRIRTARLQALGPTIGLSEQETRDYADARRRLAESVERLSEQVEKFRARVITPLKQTPTILRVMRQASARLPPTPIEALDGTPQLLNGSNGLVNLCTGQLSPHSPAALCTKLAPVNYVPDAKAPLFERVLTEALPDPEVRSYFQRVIGYGITGEVSEHCMFLLLGSGGNGKSTLLNAIAETLGDYAGVASKSLLMSGGKFAAPRDYELADLRGKRFVQVMELNEREHMDSSRLKSVVGGDRITAARKYENAITFTTQAKIIMPCNSKPRISDDDNGAWRRISLIEFPNAFLTEPDRTLPERLKAEAEGIFAWAVRGAMEWYRGGLGTPESCKAAVQEYRAGENIVAQFVEECVERRDGQHTAARVMFDRFHAWCDASHVHGLPIQDFKRRMEKLGFVLEKTKRANVWWNTDTRT